MSYEDAKVLSARLEPSAPMPTPEEVLAQIEAALTEVSALCRGKRWQMRIPVDSTDSDFAISAALMLARRLLLAGSQAPRGETPA